MEFFLYIYVHEQKTPKWDGIYMFVAAEDTRTRPTEKARSCFARQSRPKCDSQFHFFWPILMSSLVEFFLGCMFYF